MKKIQELLREGVLEIVVSNLFNRIGVYSDFDYSGERCFINGSAKIFYYLLKRIEEEIV